MRNNSGASRHIIVRTISAFVAVGTLLAVTACGSDDDSSGSPTTAASTITTGPQGSSETGSSTAPATESSNAEASGEPIVVGMVCACSGVYASLFASTSKVSEAWASSVNDSGGLNGHPVKLVVKDDGGDPAKALLAVKQLVEDEQVIAIVGDITFTQDSWADYVSQKGIPVIALPTSLQAASNPDFFSIGAPQFTFWGATTAKAVADGKKRIGVMYCSEAPACKLTADIIESFAKQVGIQFTGIAVSSTQPSYAAPCLKMKDDGVDALVVGLPTQTFVRILQECSQQGFTPAEYNNGSGYDPTWLTLPELNGMNMGSFVANFLDTSVDGVDTYHRALAQYADLDPKGLSIYDATAWTTGALFEKAATAANLGPESTPAEVKDALYALKDETVDGLTVPLNYVKDQVTVFPCQFELTIKDGDLAIESGGEPVCLTAEQADLAAQLAKG